MTSLRLVSSLALATVLFGCPPSGPKAAPTIVSFTASNTSLPAGGGQVTLSWVQADATSLTIDNGVGNVLNRSSTVVFLAQTTTYTLTASNKLGSISQQVTVNVAQPTAPPTLTGFTASPASLGILGGRVNLSWSAQNATSLFIDNGVGNVSGRTNIDVDVNATKTFTITAQNELGSVTATTTVNVEVPTTPPSIQSFTTSDDDLEPGGGWVTLRWSTTNATELSIDQGVGNVLNKTSLQVRVTSDTVFKLTARNVKGSAESVVLVRVQPQPAPRVDSFYASPASLTAPGYTTLRWSTTDADSISIDGIGDVTWEYGSLQRYVSSTRTFTLRATNETSTTSYTITVYVQQ